MTKKLRGLASASLASILASFGSPPAPGSDLQAGLPLEKESGRLVPALAAVVDRELAWRQFSLPHPTAPQRRARIGAVLAQRVEVQIELLQLGHVVVEIF